MVKTEKAFAISLISAIFIALAYWVLQLIFSINPFVVGLIVFLVSFIGMKWKKLVVTQEMK